MPVIHFKGEPGRIVYGTLTPTAGTTTLDTGLTGTPKQAFANVRGFGTGVGDHAHTKATPQADGALLLEHFQDDGAAASANFLVVDWMVIG